MIYPMLATTYRPDDWSGPCDAQPKLDGLRCLAYWQDGVVCLQSRGGKAWKLPHIAESLAFWLPADTVLDGKLYLHGRLRQDIQSMVVGAGRDQVELHCYDLMQPGAWAQRRAALRSMLPVQRGPVAPVQCDAVLTAWDVSRLHDGYVAAGYEGAMVRTLSGMYAPDKRSRDLAKVKAFRDAEFPVVGARGGIGKDEGLVIWQCGAPSGASFGVVPASPASQRAAWLRDAAQYIGHAYTVRYFGLSRDGIPQHPKGVAFRM